MRLFALLFLLVLSAELVRALNVTHFARTDRRRTLVTGARARLQWVAYVDCSLTFTEISSLHSTMLNVYTSAVSGATTTPEGAPTVPCRLTLSGQASVRTLLVFECDAETSLYGDKLRELLSTLPNALGDVCPWRLVRDAVVRGHATQSVGSFWHLDRLDQRERPLDGSYTYARNGSGTTIFVADTGCANHTDFGGRMTMGANYVGDGIDTDCNGHGTHCASIVAGTLCGAAKAADVICLKVLDCDGYGSFSSVSLALEEVADEKTSNPDALYVVSMSLAGGYYAPINAQVNALIDTYGVAVVVAAGNSATDAGGFSPASAASAMTVASSDANDALSDFSNRGSSCDIAAPGRNIRGAKYNDLNGFVLMSGTSMATPFVAGVVALALEQLKLNGESPTGAAAIALVKSMATANKVDDPYDNYGKLPLLFSSIGRASVPQPPPAPPPPPPPLAPPQSSWSAPFTRPATNEGANALILYFLTSPPAVGIAFWLFVYL